jgi:hypothetical protein
MIFSRNWILEFKYWNFIKERTAGIAAKTATEIGNEGVRRERLLTKIDFKNRYYIVLLRQNSKEING